MMGRVIGWLLLLGVAMAGYTLPAQAQNRERSAESVYIVHLNAQAQSVTGTTSETVLRRINFPGGLMGPNSAIRITAGFTFAGGAGVKVLRCYVGTADICNASQVTATNASIIKQRTFVNRNALTSQVFFRGWSEYVADSSTMSTAAVNMGQDQTITITCTAVVASDTCTSEYLLVELLKAD